jgi:hypothetical protein
VTKIVEKTYVECALHQAPHYLERFFSTQVDADGRCIVQLRAALGIGDLRADLAVPVSFDLSKLHTGADMVPKVPLHWKPEHGGPFPAFEGVLSVEGGEDYDECGIALRGTYEPPFGVAGKTFDALAGRHIARATARELLERIRTFMEGEFQETERKKRERNPA